MRYPRCAGLAAPGIPAAGSDISAAGSDIPAAFPLAYPPQALTCRLHSPWNARRIAVIGWLHCPDMRKPPFEMYRMVSKGGFRTEMALVMCFINGLKRTGCFQTAVFAHRASALLVRRRLVGVSVSCWCAGVLRFAGQEERPKTNGVGFRTRTHVVAGSLWGACRRGSLWGACRRISLPDEPCRRTRLRASAPGLEREYAAQQLGTATHDDAPRSQDMSLVGDRSARRLDWISS